MASASSSTAGHPPDDKKPEDSEYDFLPHQRKRKPKTLPTGQVKKAKPEEEDKDLSSADPMERYMAEMKQYRDKLCTEERKNRPLVK